MKETKTVVFALFADRFYHAFEGRSEQSCQGAIKSAEKEHGKNIFYKKETDPFVIWATYKDDASLCFSGNTENTCFQAVTEACEEHGRYTWYEIVNIFETPSILRPNARDVILNKLHEGETARLIGEIKNE